MKVSDTLPGAPVPFPNEPPVSAALASKISSTPAAQVRIEPR